MKTAVTASSPLRRTGPDAIVVGHRGASARVPENTLPAFLAAWDAGATWVEADTQPTTDGVPVILHDDDLDRTTSGSGPVRQLTVAKLAQLQIPGLVGAQVPRLESLLDLLGQQRALLLEIKGEHSTGEVAEIIRLCRASGHSERVFLQSFEPRVLEHIRLIEPSRPIGLLVEHLDADPVARCRTLGAVAYNPEYREVLDNPGVVTDLRAAWITVAVWTADDPADWELLTAAGVDAIITNKPAELLAWQDARSPSSDRAPSSFSGEGSSGKTPVRPESRSRRPAPDRSQLTEC